MRRLLLLSLLGACAAAALPVAASADPARPNVVVIMTDDQTYEDLAAMPRTRRLIGDAGATFTRAYVSYPLCCPSRATFLTGRYAHNHGVRTNVPPRGGVEALDAEHTLPVWLRAAGYDTGHVGKYLNGYGVWRPATVPPGWSDWHGTVDRSTYQMWGYTLHENGVDTTYGDFWIENPALYQTDVLRDRAVGFIDAHGPGGDEDPFFLSLAFVAPHGEVVEPGFGPRPHVRPAPRHLGRFGTLRLDSPAFDEIDVRDKPPYVRALRRIRPTARERMATDLRARRESLLAVDEAVEAVVGALARTGRLEDTYVLFTSDNGFFQGEHRIPKGKYLAYEPSSHVPLMLRGPGIEPLSETGELVANIDLAPTVLDAAGVSADRPLDGRSLLPFARDPFRRTRRPVLHEGLVAGDTDRDVTGYSQRRSRAGLYDAVRTSRYLFVQWGGGARELYDLARDPFELESRHRDPRYAEVRRALSAEVMRLRTCEGAGCDAPAPRLPPLSRAVGGARR